MSKLSLHRQILCASSALMICALGLYLVVVGMQHVWSGNYGLVDIGAIILGALPVFYGVKVLRSVPT